MKIELEISSLGELIMTKLVVEQVTATKLMADRPTRNEVNVRLLPVANPNPPPPGIYSIPVNVRMKLLVTYTNSTMSSEPTMALGMLFCGLCASSPVVAMMSNPMNA